MVCDTECEGVGVENEMIRCKYNYTIMAHFEHGALDRETSKLVDPKYAAKRTKYECPDCKRDVFARKGDKRVPHFAHAKDSERPCSYFNRNPSLDQQHKNAQLKLKEFLNSKVEIEIGRYCMCGCHLMVFTTISASHTGEGRIEHTFTFNDSRKSADVALVDGNEIHYIFEIVHTHHTRERNRPDPWFEIRAEDVNATESDSKEIVLTCIRQVRSPKCIEAEKVRNERLAKAKRIRIDRMSEHDRRFHEWVKMEDERMAIIIAKDDKKEKDKAKIPGRSRS
jgi:hypothetical protein